jgi:hypothetical protein
MRIAFETPFLLLLCLGSLAGQVRSKTTSWGFVYSDRKLAFQYTAPPGMRDKTENTKAEMQTGSMAPKNRRIFDLLLAMESSQPESPSWNSITIETYPRNFIMEKDDLKAEAQMNAWVAGLRRSLGTPKQTVISGQMFAVSVLALQEGSTRKGAVIWTTIRKGKLLSFAFVGTSPGRLKELTETMKTVQFY